MSTDTADHGHGRRRSDLPGAEPAVRDDAFAARDGSAPLSPAQVRTRSGDGVTTPGDAPRTREDDIDDGTPEGAGESDASEADETDDPATTPIAVAAPASSRRRGDGSARDNRHHPRRRRTDGPPDLEPPPTRKRGRAGWIAATVVFMLLFGGATALDWYLWNTTEEWEARSEALTEINYDLGARLSSEQQTTMQLASEIDLLTQQLATSNQKVTALSAEKASAVDESAFYLQQIDALEGTVSSAAGVANALHRCVDGQQELITYLQDAESYDPDELAAFSSSVRALCAEAERANERLQTALAE
ncbi:MAG: hypothetical protein ACK4MD_10095 [Demequina sp.]